MKRDYVKTGLKVVGSFGVCSLVGGATALIGLASPCGAILFGCRIVAGAMITSRINKSVCQEIDETVDLACDIVDEVYDLYLDASIKG